MSLTTSAFGNAIRGQMADCLSLGAKPRCSYRYTHGVMLVDVFYENVSKAKFEGTLLETHERDDNVVLEFRPDNGELMYVACLWSRWSAPGEPDLLSFAAITDEPPPEIAAAGHDRCIVPIKPRT
jgi:putative SOS response-associated peptidase YedK